MSYSNPTTVGYRFPAAAVDTVAVVGKIIGPSGMAGRVVDVGYVVTVAIVGAASVITVGSTGDTDAYITSMSIPVSSAGAAGNGATAAAQHEITADTIVQVTSDVGATSGDADILVTIDWY